MHEKISNKKYTHLHEKNSIAAEKYPGFSKMTHLSGIRIR